jgi:hypothetical protein
LAQALLGNTINDSLLLGCAFWNTLNTSSANAWYNNLTLDLPLEARGREQSAGNLGRYGARLEEYSIHTVVIPS